ncbi:hypothetical protein [Dongia sp.]|uniref:hypothetical protein n=1 Tax=Dongia sp. TaxID=1977262 RepID=UPI003751D157
MAKNSNKAAVVGRSELRMRSEPTGSAKKTAKVTFGGVTVSAPVQSLKLVRKNIKEGQTALKRAAGALTHSGVALKVSKDVPLFYADRDDPKTIIRELNGKKEKGVLLKGGRFRVIHK